MSKLGGMSNDVMLNEVAPGQNEISSIFALSSVSADQKALCQDVLSQRASKHGLTLLLILLILLLGIEHRHWGRRAKSSKSFVVFVVGPGGSH